MKQSKNYSFLFQKGLIASYSQTQILILKKSSFNLMFSPRRKFRISTILIKRILKSLLFWLGVGSFTPHCAVSCRWVWLSFGMGYSRFMFFPKIGLESVIWNLICLLGYFCWIWAETQKFAFQNLCMSKARAIFYEYHRRLKCTK